ncbi:MAG: ABC transporter ATP-binding protein [Firmicutes bacterium]|nr:ABC transporter ATP-binding protein [Bacillota bacterium]
MASLVTIEDLGVEYRSRGEVLRAAHNVRFFIGEGEAVGLVGESGSGKSTIGKAILRLLPPNGRIVSGRIMYQGRDLAAISPEEMRGLRWSRIAMIFQSSMNSLNPVYRVGDQIIEAIRTHNPGMKRAVALERTCEVLANVGIDPSRHTSYPHQLSGGMRQRVNIAMALALSPPLIIADEPTTALDVVTQDRVLRELKLQQEQRRISMLLVSHDIAVIAENCDRVAVMYAGTIAEFAPTKNIFNNPYHPYTLGLQNAFPDFRSHRALVSIPGFPPTGARSRGCMFVQRCPFAEELCSSETPRPTQVEDDHWVACHFTQRASEFQRLARDPDTWLGRTG